MKSIKILALFTVLFLLTPKATAETWREPWQKEIIQKSEYFILGKVIDVDEKTGVVVEVLKSFGASLQGNITINGFSMLQLMSSSGHGVHIEFKKDQTLYLLLTKGKDGNYLIPTPSSGYAPVDEDHNVYGAYRISMHYGRIPQDIYEMTYSEIWNYYKKGTYDRKKMADFINAQLEKAPAGFEKEEQATFFLQHVALETAYLLDIEIPLSKLTPFFAIDNFHSRVSALLVLSNAKEAAAKEYLFNFIKNPKNGDFEKVMAIRSLDKCGRKEYKSKLKKIAKELSDEYVSFGLNIMDPRVATTLPSPRTAVEEL